MYDNLKLGKIMSEGVLYASKIEIQADLCILLDKTHCFGT
jgi:hypothetical protein